jgi:uroporphyrinogen decarboxylase
LTGKERVTAALNGERPDTVPVMLHNFMHAAAEAGISMAEFRNNPVSLAKAFIQAVERYGYDAVLVDVDTVTLAGAVGVPVDFPDDHPARAHKGCLASLDQIEDLEPVDLDADPRIQVWLEGTERLKQHFGEEIFVRGNCDQAPFSLASMMRSAQDWMLDLTNKTNHQKIHNLLHYCSEVCGQFIELMAETGADMVSNGDSPAGPEMISPLMYKEFAWPYERKLVTRAHSLGLPYLLHICGNTDPILQEMVYTGADCLEFDQKTDSQLAHDLLKDKCVFVGNIDPSGVLALGTPELVRQETRQLIEQFSDTSRFILNSGCAMPAFTPSENVHALIETARVR